MTITRIQCFSLLEGLSDKSLTFGCRLKLKDNADSNGETWTLYEEVTHSQSPICIGLLRLCSGRASGTKIAQKRDISYILGHPVTLLEILAKWSAKWDDDAYYTIAEASNLLRLWKPFGFKTPLRDILEGAKTEERMFCPVCKAWLRFDRFEGNVRCHPAPNTDEVGERKRGIFFKDEKVEALCQFLISLQLVK